MKIIGMGLNFAGNPIFPSMDEAAMAKALVASLERNADRVRGLAQTTTGSVTFRGEIEREILDPGDPRIAGWTFLVNSSDPRLDEIEAILEPLATHRGMTDPKEHLLFNGESADEWFDWLQDNYYALELEGKQVPSFILIVGGPEQVPFRLQSILDTAANVGRVDFETLDELKNYADKLIRIETAPEPPVSSKVVLFAPDAGLPDPTYFSRLYMVEPIAEHIKENLGIDPSTILADDATKANILATLKEKKPALVYTASHGLGAIEEPFDIQKRYNGAICCQHTGALTLESLISADDVSYDEPFLEGAVFFQFACFSYGTPAESDYNHWLTEGVPEKYTDEDFVAALPKRLLAHPKGPIAFIGHLDTAWLHGFVDVETPHILDRWHTRISPFVQCVNQLLRVQPSGLAMEGMNTKYSVCNAMITSAYDRQRRGKLTWNTRLEERFLDTWITRSDAQNYMIFGDPAAHLRIPKGE